MRTRFYRQHQDGDTLIEVIFALVIIGVIVSVALHGAIQSHRSAVAARERTEATYLAKMQTEFFRSVYHQLGAWDTGTISDPGIIQFLQTGSIYYTEDFNIDIINSSTGECVDSNRQFTMTSGIVAIPGSFPDNRSELIPAQILGMFVLPTLIEDMPDPEPDRVLKDYNISITINCDLFNNGSDGDRGTAGDNRKIIQFITRVTWTDTQGKNASVEMNNYLAEGIFDN